jgi:hypothetical protein
MEGVDLCRTTERAEGQSFAGPFEGGDHKPEWRASHIKGSQGLTPTAGKRGRCQEKPHT